MHYALHEPKAPDWPMFFANFHPSVVEINPLSVIKCNEKDGFRFIYRRNNLIFEP